MRKNNTNIDYLPPKLTLNFLNWFCSIYYLEEIEGDLIEKFEKRKNDYPKIINQLLFVFGVMGFCRPIFWRKELLKIDLWEIVMLKSNAKFAVRNILKNGFFSTINISGLALGIASVLLIFFYIQDEISYDQFFKDSDRIYRVTVNANFKGNDFNTARVGGIVAPTMLKDFPEVENFVRIESWGMCYVKYEEQTFKEHHILGVDNTFFEIFSIPIIEGDPETIFSNPASVAISKKIAEKYFGNTDPIGKELSLDDRNTFNVSGVFENIPENSHLKIDFLLSNDYDKYIDENGWTNEKYYTYILLKKNADINGLRAKMPSLMNNYGWPEIENFGVNVKELLASGTFWNFTLQKLTDVHFDTFHAHNLSASTDFKYIIIFSGIAIFILLIASINFINLSTAKSACRAKEVGIKKVLGSYRKDLIVQFLTESIVISLISFIIAVGIVELTKNVFFEVIGKEFKISYIDNPGFLFALINVILFTGLVAGSFPAFILSKFSPTAVLRGNLKNIMSKGWFRSSLVVFQFTASLILIIGTIIIFNQIEYMRNQNLGFDKEQVLIINDPYILKDEDQIYKERLLEHKDVYNATMSGFLPVDSYRNTQGFFLNGNLNDPKIRPYQKWYADENYFATLGIEIIEGRNFSLDFSTDKEAIIINKACRDYLELEKPLENTLGRSTGQNDFTEYQIIGVVENFNFESLKNNVEPIVFMFGAHSGNLVVKLKGNIPDVIDYAKDKWEELAPNQPFSYQFMDESFDKVYKAEANMLNLFQYFALIAVFIGCLGLFALSAYTVERRTKEIGIRKVMGAKITGLVFHLTREFAALIIVAFLIASPIAYYLMESWLSNYAYRVDIGMGVFILAGSFAMIVALATISFNAVKAAIMNPIKSLRYE